jgi:hypothetical protein
MIIVQGPSTTDTKYGRLCILLEWTSITRHDLTTRNLWPKPEITTNQELHTMPMHDKKWGADGQILQQNSQPQDQYLLQQQHIDPP